MFDCPEVGRNVFIASTRASGGRRARSIFVFVSSKPHFATKSRISTGCRSAEDCVDLGGRRGGSGLRRPGGGSDGSWGDRLRGLAVGCEGAFVGGAVRRGGSAGLLLMVVEVGVEALLIGGAERVLLIGVALGGERVNGRFTARLSSVTEVLGGPVSALPLAGPSADALGLSMGLSRAISLDLMLLSSCCSSGRSFLRSSGSSGSGAPASRRCALMISRSTFRSSRCQAPLMK